MNEVNKCTHHWIIEARTSADRAVAKGKCKLCGAERTFNDQIKFTDDKNPHIDTIHNPPNSGAMLNAMNDVVRRT